MDIVFPTVPDISRVETLAVLHIDSKRIPYSNLIDKYYSKSNCEGLNFPVLALIEYRKL